MSDIPGWAERAEKELHDRLSSGELSDSEYDDEMRALRRELAVQDSYDEAIRPW